MASNATDDSRQDSATSTRTRFCIFGFFLILASHYQYNTLSRWLQTPQWSLDVVFNDVAKSVSSSFAVDSQTPASMIGLDELTVSFNTTCPSPLDYLPNYHANMSQVKQRKIPYIIHITSKTRCLHPGIHANVQRWRKLLGRATEIDGEQVEEYPYSVYFHDDDAVDRLFAQHWDLFPNIDLVRKCINSGAGIADIWRYLVLWEYGGIYSGTISCFSLYQG